MSLESLLLSLYPVPVPVFVFGFVSVNLLIGIQQSVFQIYSIALSFSKWLYNLSCDTCHIHSTVLECLP